MALNWYEYRDPMLVVQERQEARLKRMCSGCAHEHQAADPFGETRLICLTGRAYGRRCKDYMERTGMTLEESEEIEELLAIWYDWSQSYRPALGAPRASPFVRLAPQSNIEHDPEDAAARADERINANLAEQVELCIDQLPGIQYKAAINLSLRNKRGPAVWRNPRQTTEESHRIYQQAKELLMPMLRKRNVMKT